MEHIYQPPSSGYGNCVTRPPEASPRVGDWMQGYKGEKFWPFDPRPEDVHLETIAHALAHQCRFGGHTRHFYSVAQHCVLASRFQEETFPFEKLMHDASEAYLQDIPRPIKRQFGMEKYREIEDKWHRVLADKYGFVYPYPEAVHLADEVMLHTEAKALMAHGAWHEIIDWKFLEQFGDDLPVIERIEPVRAEQVFLTRFHDLTNGKWT